MLISSLSSRQAKLPKPRTVAEMSNTCLHGQDNKLHILGHFCACCDFFMAVFYIKNMFRWGKRNTNCGIWGVGSEGEVTGGGETCGQEH